MAVAFAGITGKGFQAFGSAGSPTFERVAVTSLGTAEALVSAPPIRYLHLGMWAFYEDLVGDPDLPDGLYLSQFHWMSFALESWADTTAVDAQGYSGFFFDLAPGVVATFWFYGL
jgi:hypothetical protein